MPERCLGLREHAFERLCIQMPKGSKPGAKPRNLEIILDVKLIHSNTGRLRDHTACQDRLRAITLQLGASPLPPLQLGCIFPQPLKDILRHAATDDGPWVPLAFEAGHDWAEPQLIRVEERMVNARSRTWPVLKLPSQKVFE